MALSSQHGHSYGRGGRDDVNNRFTRKQTTPDFGHLGGKVQPLIATLLAAGPAAEKLGKILEGSWDKMEKADENHKRV